MRLLPILICFLAFQRLSAATYYVDFDGGSDAAAGTSTGTAWKHSPFDGNATGNAASTTPAAGDTIQFKAGVSYKGQLIINSSGTAGNPITYKGTGWGVGKARFDGFSLFTNSWTQCSASGQVYGNANYASIWFANALSTNQTSLTTIVQSNQALPFAQITTPEQPVFWDTISNWTTLAVGDVGQSTLTDTSRFTQSDVDFWRGSYLALHKSPNAVSIKLIAGLNTGTDTITNAAHNDTDFYSPSPFEIIGHPLYISYPGEYAVITNRIWMWPTNGSDPNNLTIYVATLTNAITIAAENYVTIDGFEIEGYFGGLDVTYDGYAVANNGSGNYRGINVLNCDVRNIRSMTQGGTVSLGNASDSLVMGSSISDCIRSRGGIYTGTNITIASNAWIRLGGTAVFFSGCWDSRITSNYLHSIRGAHGNGLSVYSDSANVIVDRNALWQCGNPMTWERGSNYVVRNNFVDCTYGAVEEWGGMYGPTYVLCNTFVNHDAGSAAQNHFAVNVRPQNPGAFAYVIGNATDGMGGWTNYPYPQANVYRAFNHWLGSNANANPSGVKMTNGETFSTNLALAFVGGGIYDPIAEGYLANAGTNLTSYGFTDDLRGSARGEVWDIGAFEQGSEPAGVGPAGVRQSPLQLPKFR